MPEQVVIMNNATFHTLTKIKDLIEGADCILIFLPAYSPDLNPIEKYAPILKIKIRSSIKYLDHLFDVLDYGFNL